ncbi:MAG: NAD-binding protein [Candidatus Hermodarchaeota archaeon]
MVVKQFIKIKILLKQNWVAFSIVILWFLVNFLYFSTITKNIAEGGLIIFFFLPHNSLYGNFYAAFTEFIIFGLIFSLITVELFRKYNPCIAAREVAKKYSDHAVIIGYTHIGKRIANYLKEKQIQYVIIENDYDLVEDLVVKENAVVNDTPLNIEALKDAGIERAKVVYVTSNDFEIQVVVNHNVRRLNPRCKLVARIFEDDVAESISKTYNAEIISTSKYASDIILEKILRANYKNVLLIGLNHISLRLIKKLKLKNYVKFQLIEENEDLISDYIDDSNYIIPGDPKDLTTLQKAGIKEVQCIINTIPDVKDSFLITKRIRELNRNCKIISRFFLDSVAEILEKPPFRSEVISSSHHTLEMMIEKGMFNF